MKALVTGSTGFIGGRLSQALIARGIGVRAFHRQNSSLRLLEGLPVEHVIGDITQPETLETAMQGIEVVFHTAALMGSGADAPGLNAVTVEGTRAVLQAALRAGVQRVVHTSSLAALGVPPRPGWGRTIPSVIDENHTWNYPPDRWLYGYAKYLAELEVQRAVAQGLDVVIVNPSTVFGAGDVYRQNRSLVVRIARRQLPVMVEGGINVVHIADVIAGHLAALEHGQTGERYLLGGENLTFMELCRKIAVVVGAPAPALLVPAWLARSLAGALRGLNKLTPIPLGSSSLQWAGHYFYCDTRKAQVELKLPPPLPVEDALAEAYAWFLESGTLQQP
ncbi:MAG: NAD-dependent epimerase/dehydratase family protein [Anaerolineaceae bacterium]|nr:NAD-dependent epimerase/dehydratase family protein [Anaerolineaceae bacterium]